MTAPEPLKLTLEEALRHPEIDSIRYDESRRWVAFYIEYGEVAHECEGETWPEAVSAALGRPVVERDDTAELVELLARMTYTVRSLYQNAPPAGDDAEVLALIAAAEAALARVKGGEQ